MNPTTNNKPSPTHRLYSLSVKTMALAASSSWLAIFGIMIHLNS